MLISTDSYYICRIVGEEEGLELIKSQGFEAVDYSIFNWGFMKNVLDGDYIKNAERTRKTMDSLGLVCNQCHSPYKKLAYESVLNESNIDYVHVLRSIEFASVIGAKAIVVHAFGNPNGPDSQQCIDYNIRFYEGLEKTARKNNVQISIENMIKNCLNKPDLMNRTMQNLDPEVFNVCFDVGHSLCAGVKPQDYIRGLDKGTLKYLHIQDNDGTKDSHLLPYTCSVDWDEVLAALKEYGYNGDINLEIPLFYKNMPKELLPKAISLAADTAAYIRSKLS